MSSISRPDTAGVSAGGNEEPEVDAAASDAVAQASAPAASAQQGTLSRLSSAFGGVEHIAQAGVDRARHAVTEGVHDARAIAHGVNEMAHDATASVEHAVDFARTHDLDDIARGLTTPDQKAQVISSLLGGTTGLVEGTIGLMPGHHSVPEAVLDVLRSCRSAAEIDAVVGRVGSARLMDGLGSTAGAEAHAMIERLRAADARPGDWQGFDRYVDQVTGTRSTQGNSVELFDNGTRAFPAIFDAVDHAQSSVNVETFEFHDDATGREYAQHLIAAARRGCTVNVMMDEHGSAAGGGPEIAAMLRAGGVHVAVSPTDMLVSKIDHRKVCVVDGRVGFAGGMNIGDDYRTNWHDMHSRVEGPAVQSLQQAFLSRWSELGQSVPAGVDYFPDPVARGGQDVRIVPHDGGHDENIRMTYLRAIDTAQTSIRIENPYFVDGDVLSHLEAAARRGVDVRCVWPALNDQAVLRDAARARYAELIAAGVHVYEYQPTMAHEKVCSIDGRFATVGSSNLDARSLHNNNELNVVSLDWRFSNDLAAAIDRDIARSAEITDGEALRAHDPVQHQAAGRISRVPLAEEEL